MSKITEIHDADFESLIQNEPLVVVDFMVPWCGPCRKVARFLEDLADNFADQTTVVKIDTEQNSVISKQFEVVRLPEVLLFKNGELVERILGAKPYGTFAAAVTKHLA